jgi:hypothetical protein
MSWRVVIVTRISPVLAGFDAVVRAAGHEPVALLTMRDVDGRYGNLPGIGELLTSAAPELDVLLPARRSTIAPLLAWAIREGDEEIGITFHRMDADLDTGPILSQRRYPLGELQPPDTFYPELGQVVGEALAEALERLAAGDEGTPQEEAGSYESFFDDDDAWLDLTRPAAEVHRLAWGWRYAISLGGTQGALLELDGFPVRVLATSLTEVEGARRLDCGDGPLWLVETEELSEEEARPSSAPAPSTH